MGHTSHRRRTRAEQAEDRTRTVALKLAAIQRRLEPGDDYFVTHITRLEVDFVYDTSGKQIGACSHAAINAFIRRGWITDQGEHDKGRLFGITPEGHEAVEAVGKVKAA